MSQVPGHLPGPVRRWASRTGTGTGPQPLSARLWMHGQIRVGRRWRPFTARQEISPTGYVWAATVGRGPMRITGSDRYLDGRGRLHWRWIGLVPVVDTSGDDVSRSAAGRHAGELLVLTPGGPLAPGVTWSGTDERQAVAQVADGHYAHEVTLSFDPEGRLAELVLDRWGDPDGRGAYGTHPFGVVFEGERTFGGHLLPAALRAGWWYSTDRWDEGEFFRGTLDRAEFG